METLYDIIGQIKAYTAALDWAFIITFIIICYGVNHYTVTDGLQSKGIGMKTRYRVLIIGIVYGTALYFIRGYTISQIETLFQSFVFALVFHKFIIEALLYWLAKHALPEDIAKHLFNEEELKKLYPHEN